MQIDKQTDIQTRWSQYFVDLPGRGAKQILLEKLLNFIFRSHVQWTGGQWHASFGNVGMATPYEAPNASVFKTQTWRKYV